MPRTRRLPRVAVMLAAAAPVAFMLTMTSADGAQGTSAAANVITPARQKELVHMVRHDCGSCHGLTLQGGLGPPLTPQALRGKPVEYVKAMILDSRPGTAMPHWRPLLPVTEAVWIAEKLLQGMPDAK